MDMLLIACTAILLWTTALGPMLKAADKREEIEFEQRFRRFQLRSVKKYHGLFHSDAELKALSLDDIDRDFRVEQIYHEIGRS